MEQVNHPKHYNARPDGLECIEIIRHYIFDVGCAIKYLWRAGLKPEMGKEDIEKEIEDLQKSIWYIDDQLYYGIEKDGFSEMEREDGEILEEKLFNLTGKYFVDVAESGCYGKHIGNAIYSLLHVGLMSDGYVYRIKNAVKYLRDARKEIEERIEELGQQATEKES